MTMTWMHRGIMLAALILVILGIVSIILGFGYAFPNARIPGTIFFVGGCLLFGVGWVTRQLDKILGALTEKGTPE